MWQKISCSSKHCWNNGIYREFSQVNRLIVYPQIAKLAWLAADCILITHPFT